MTSTTSAGVVEREGVGPLGEVLRDIARGGTAGLLVGFIVAGIGGRIVMRLAAFIVPTSVGSFTENGNRIGDITLSGSLGLIAAGGLFFGTFAGTVWVVVAPWIPGTGVRRAILAMPIAVALTAGSLVQASNPDFRILRHDGLIVAMLIALVAIAGGSIALVDGWLDRRLPPHDASGRAEAAYTAVALAGGLLIFPVVVLTYLGAATLLGLALVAVGLATLARWRLRMQGRPRPWRLLIAGRAALLVAVGLGLLELAPDVAGALGAT
jgi:hypothetical protein